MATNWLCGELRRLQGEVRSLKEKDEKKKNTKKIVSVEPLWWRSQKDVTNEEYVSLYKSLSNDGEDFWASRHVHFCVEGLPEFRAVLFVPQEKLLESKKKRNNIRIFERRIFLRDDCDELVPEWLNIVFGVVDSIDLPCNSREKTVQQDKAIRIIRNTLVAQCLDMLAEIAEKVKDTNKFHEQFGNYLNPGIFEEPAIRREVVKFFRFHSSKSGPKKVSFLDYVGRMKEGQTCIYYITGDNLEEVSSSPSMEKFRKKDVEVLYMMDPDDEFLVQQVKKFDGIRLRSIEDEQDVEQNSLKEYVDRVMAEYVDTKVQERIEEKISPQMKQLMQMMLEFSKRHPPT